jgi:DNA repair protein RecO (recombination protein O)
MVLGRETGREVFALVDAALAALDARGARMSVVRTFELHLLDAVGYRPAFDRCRACSRSATTLPSVVAVPSRGGVFCPPCRPSTETGYAIAARVLTTLVALQHRPFDAPPSTAEEENDVIRTEHVLQAFIDQLLSRPLKSRGFLTALRQFSPPC